MCQAVRAVWCGVAASSGMHSLIHRWWPFAAALANGNLCCLVNRCADHLSILHCPPAFPTCACSSLLLQQLIPSRTNTGGPRETTRHPAHPQGPPHCPLLSPRLCAYAWRHLQQWHAPLACSHLHCAKMVTSFYCKLLRCSCAHSRRHTLVAGRPVAVWPATAVAPCLQVSLSLLSIKMPCLYCRALTARKATLAPTPLKPCMARRVGVWQMNQRSAAPASWCVGAAWP
jgi:hypothetical protein